MPFRILLWCSLRSPFRIPLKIPFEELITAHNKSRKVLLKNEFAAHSIHFTIFARLRKSINFLSKQIMGRNTIVYISTFWGETEIQSIGKKQFIFMGIQNHEIKNQSIGIYGNNLWASIFWIFSINQLSH